MEELTNNAQIFLDGDNSRTTFTLYKNFSAQNHAISSDEDLRLHFTQALSRPVGDGKVYQENDDSYRVSINNGKGYLVYKIPAVSDNPNSAVIFHYHWNYNLDGSHV